MKMVCPTKPHMFFHMLVSLTEIKISNCNFAIHNFRCDKMSMGIKMKSNGCVAMQLKHQLDWRTGSCVSTCLMYSWYYWHFLSADKKERVLSAVCNQAFGLHSLWGIFRCQHGHLV